MKHMHPQFESDLANSFERLWRELEEREATSDRDYSNVRLDCTGELAHIGSIVLLSIRAASPGTQLIEFRCPRCGQRHESHVLR